MEDVSGTLESMGEATTGAIEALVESLPLLVAALLLVLAGWVVARLARGGTMKLAAGVNALLVRFGRRRVQRSAQMTPAVVSVVGNVAFWLVMLVAVALAARVGGLQMFTVWLDRIVSYLPTLLAGGLILLAGWLVSTLARDVVAAALESAGSEQSHFFGLMAQAAIFLAALVIGLDQIGIDVTMLTILFGVIVGGLLLCLALAFGLGARSFVGNLIGAQQIRGLLQPGQRARIGEHEGTVVELTPTTVVLATEQGHVTIPAKLFQEQVTLVYAPEDDD